MQNELLKLINECHKQNSNCEVILLGSQAVIDKITLELPEYCKTTTCVSDFILEEDTLYVFADSEIEEIKLLFKDKNKCGWGTMRFPKNSNNKIEFMFDKNSPFSDDN